MFDDTQFLNPIIFEDVEASKRNAPIIFDDITLLQEKEIYSLKKENLELKSEKKQLNDTIEKIRISSGRITGLATGALKDNK